VVSGVASPEKQHVRILSDVFDTVGQWRHFAHVGSHPQTCSAPPNHPSSYPPSSGDTAYSHLNNAGANVSGAVSVMQDFCLSMYASHGQHAAGRKFHLSSLSRLQ